MGTVNLIYDYFPELTEEQRERFARLEGLYREWNEKINVISRKDMDEFWVHHVLHSLAIAKIIRFAPGTRVMDVGTGGGFPGIPLAILFPEVNFYLIDSIGKKRDGASGLSGNDEREQTLNQLLTEMDGFDATKGVVILAATNRPESLDPALTRPGRFDRRVPVELPDLKGRESILRLHAKKVKLGPDCDFGVVARMTPGASGAELANIVNEAALCAVRHRRKAVTQFDLQEAVDTILAGAQKKNKILNNKEKCIVSYHEVGHALVAALQTNSAPVQKITIVPRTSGALGFTMQVEDGDHTLMTKEEILNKIATLTGGRAAEELIFHSITTGASNDIEQATKLARALVTRYGMTEDFDMVALETVNNAYLGGDASLACSEQTAAQVDAKVVEIVQAEHKKAYQLLADNKRKLDEIAQYLYEKETISGEEFMRILNAQPQLPAGPSADSTNQAQ